MIAISPNVVKAAIAKADEETTELCDDVASEPVMEKACLPKS
jgi:hypothetical protein